MHLASFVADCVADPSSLGITLTNARKARAGSITIKVTIIIRGACRVTQPLELGPEDSNMEWIGEAGAAITGGISISETAWKKYGSARCNACGTLWRVQLDATTTDSRQLYVDGVRANRTVMLFPQAEAIKNAKGYFSPLARL